MKEITMSTKDVFNLLKGEKTIRTLNNWASNVFTKNLYSKLIKTNNKAYYIYNEEKYNEISNKIKQKVKNATYSKNPIKYTLEEVLFILRVNSHNLLADLLLENYKKINKIEDNSLSKKFDKLINIVDNQSKKFDIVLDKINKRDFLYKEMLQNHNQRIDRLEVEVSKVKLIPDNPIQIPYKEDKPYFDFMYEVKKRLYGSLDITNSEDYKIINAHWNYLAGRLNKLYGVNIKLFLKDQKNLDFISVEDEICSFLYNVPRMRNLTLRIINELPHRKNNNVIDINER